MRRLLLSLLAGLALCAPCSGHGQTGPAPPLPTVNYAYLFQNFSETGLSPADKRFLHAALALEGDYAGRIDGTWGPSSRRALDHYATRRFGRPAETWHMAVLAMDLVMRIEAEGWHWQYFDGPDLSLLVPGKAARAAPAAPDVETWRHGGRSLTYSLAVLTRASAEARHAFALGRHQMPEPAYTLRRPDLAITRARRADGAVLYVRSDYVDGGWSTVLLSADGADQGLLNAVAASRTTGQAPPLQATPGGQLDRAIRTAFDVMKQAGSREGKQAFDAPAPLAVPDPSVGDVPGATTGPPRQSPPQTGPQSAPQSGAPAPRGARATRTGSGFYVSGQGHVLTNAHVVTECASIEIDGQPARLLARADGDLALLATDRPTDSFASFSATPARLNADVTALGYPLSHLLGGLNVTRGAVSATTGLSGDRDTMQITAPVQPGNSGGPLIGPDGNVVGVVVAKLDALGIAESLGDIPQNVNFAIRADLATGFLTRQGIAPRIARASAPLAPEDLAEQAAAFTAFIACTPP